jgi:hypothetical protein
MLLDYLDVADPRCSENVLLLWTGLCDGHCE